MSNPYQQSVSVPVYVLHGETHPWTRIVLPKDRDYSAEVALIQECLGVTNDGKIGPHTRDAALRAFRVLNGLEPPPAPANAAEEAPAPVRRAPGRDALLYEEMENLRELLFASGFPNEAHLVERVLSSMLIDGISSISGAVCK